jgi:hypothetical protein
LESFAFESTSRIAFATGESADVIDARPDARVEAERVAGDERAEGEELEDALADRLPGGGVALALDRLALEVGLLVDARELVIAAQEVEPAGVQQEEHEEQHAHLDRAVAQEDVALVQWIRDRREYAQEIVDAIGFRGFLGVLKKALRNPMIFPWSFRIRVLHTQPRGYKTCMESAFFEKEHELRITGQIGPRIAQGRRR